MPDPLAFTPRSIAAPTPIGRQIGKTADPDGSKLEPIPTDGAQVVRLGFCCDAPNCTLTARLYFCGPQEPFSVATATFTTGATPDYGNVFYAVPAEDPCWPLGGATSVICKVDSVAGAGYWRMFGMMI